MRTYDSDDDRITFTETTTREIDYRRPFLQFLQAAFPTRWPDDLSKVQGGQPVDGYNYAQLYEDIFSTERLGSFRDRLRGLFLDTGDNTKRRFGKMVFLGSGLPSLFWRRVLHDRLDRGLDILGGLQQGGTTTQEQYEYQEQVKGVVRDIAVALTGYDIEFTARVERDEIGEPLPPSVEAEVAPPDETVATQIDRFFQVYIPTKYADNPDEVAKINALYLFDIAGYGSVLLDFTRIPMVIVERGSAAAYDETQCCHIEISAEDFAGLIDRPETGMMLFMMGKMKVDKVGFALGLQAILE